MPRSSSRDDRGTTRTGGARRCPVCAVGFTPVGRQAYCSTACRKRAFRARRGPAPLPVLPAGSTRRQHTVYECGDCGERRLGEQYCPDCGTFGRAAGLGGTCPHCGEPVTADELDLAVGDRR